MSIKKEHEISFGFQSEQEAIFPVLVQLALMHYICNSKCIKCPVGLHRRGQMGENKTGEFDPKMRTFFSFQLFKKVADEMAKYPWSILRLHGRGEPLMHLSYVNMIEYAKKAGVGTITSFTNGILLDQEKAELILDAGLDLLECSVDAYSENLYKEFRGTDCFSQVVANVQNFISIRNSRGRECHTMVIVSAVDCPEFQLEKQNFFNYWNAKADKVIVRPYHTYGGRLKALSDKVDIESVPCAQLWTRFSINPWGKVNACFNDWADEEIIGDLNDPDTSIAKIWRNKKFEAIRKNVLQKESQLSCCAHCLATKEGWIYSYQRLIEQMRQQQLNLNLGEIKNE